jgi:hypothetical protein
MATGNAKRLIQACQKYREAHGDYPEKLSQLVPDYLGSVPMAKYCCFMGEFQYWSSSDEPPRHLLLWCEFPPFGRHTYLFERGTWRYID